MTLPDNDVNAKLAEAVDYDVEVDVMSTACCQANVPDIVGVEDFHDH